MRFGLARKEKEKKIWHVSPELTKCGARGSLPRGAPAPGNHRYRGMRVSQDSNCLNLFKKWKVLWLVH